MFEGRAGVYIKKDSRELFQLFLVAQSKQLVAACLSWFRTVWEGDGKHTFERQVWCTYYIQRVGYHDMYTIISGIMLDEEDS